MLLRKCAKMLLRYSELANQHESRTNDIKNNLVKQKSKLFWDPLQQLLGFLCRGILDGRLALQFQKKMK